MDWLLNIYKPFLMAGQRSKPREDSRTGDAVSGQLSPSRHVSRALCVSRLCHPQLRESHTEERCSPLRAANMNAGPPEAALGFSWLLVHSHSAVAAVGRGHCARRLLSEVWVWTGSLLTSTGGHSPQKDSLMAFLEKETTLLLHLVGLIGC